MDKSASVRILYMEADAELANLVKKHLNLAGYSVDIAGSGKVGLEMCQAGQYDAILVNYELPDYTGFEIIRELASQEQPPPAVMITDSGNEMIAVKAMKLGFGDYIVKDVDRKFIEVLPRVFERLLEHHALIKEKEMTKEELKQRIEFERLIIRLSSELVGLAGNEVDAGINRALASICAFTNADRAYLFLFQDDGLLVDNTHEFCTDGIEPVFDTFKGIPVDKRLPRFAEYMRNNKTFSVSDVLSLPPEAKSERRHFTVLGILSLVAVPMMAADRLIGFLGFDVIRRHRLWSNDDQLLLRFVGEAFTNLLARKRAEEKRAASDQLREKLLDSIWMFIGLLKPDGEIIFLNRSALITIEIEPEDAMGKKFYDLYWWTYSDETREIIKQDIEKAVSGNSALHIVQARAADGSLVWLEFNIHPIYDKHGEVEYLVPEGYNITKRKKTEDALEFERAQLLSIFDGMDNIIYIIDIETYEVLYVNQATKNIFQKEMIGGTCYGEFRGLNSPCEHCTTDLLKQKSGIFQNEHHNPVSNRDYAINSSLIKWPDGRDVKLGIAFDITERKKAEEERLSLERQVQHAQKLESIGVLAGGIAHDFNNLLMAILGNVDLALHRLSPMSPAHKNIKEIENASMRAADLARQMLAYSGKGRFVLEPINLNIFIKEIINLLEVSISKKAVIKYNFAENLPVFNGDTTQISQVIMNLVTNASEAINDKSGIIAVSTGAMYCDRAYIDSINDFPQTDSDKLLPEGIYTYLEVADTGCGMDSETIKKIFDPFFTTKFTGRGLGMSAVLGIIRGHDGSIKIYSEVGKGTTFKIFFPANKQSGNGFISVKEDEPLKDWSGNGTVLIVDDEETVCAVGRDMLESIGYTVFTASDGREAMKVFSEHFNEIVCVLLDLTMPHMNGVETFRKMRQIHPDVKVILCSGYNEQNATQQFAGKGLAGFIQKPYRLLTLKETLADILAKNDNKKY